MGTKGLSPLLFQPPPLSPSFLSFLFVHVAMALFFIVVVNEVVHVVHVFLLLASSNTLLIVPDARDVICP
jgi:hypothetical protein